MKTPKTENGKRAKAGARLAAEWWGALLDQQYDDEREDFEKCLAAKVETALLQNPESSVSLQCDYNPKGLLLEAVQETIAPECSGTFFSARDIFPSKHGLVIFTTHLEPKTGYRNWGKDIPVEGSLD